MGRYDDRKVSVYLGVEGAQHLSYLKEKLGARASEVVQLALLAVYTRLQEDGEA